MTFVLLNNPPTQPLIPKYYMYITTGYFLDYFKEQIANQGIPTSIQNTIILQNQTILQPRTNVIEIKMPFSGYLTLFISANFGLPNLCAWNNNNYIYIKINGKLQYTKNVYSVSNLPFPSQNCCGATIEPSNQCASGVYTQVDMSDNTLIFLTCNGAHTEIGSFQIYPACVLTCCLANSPSVGYCNNNNFISSHIPQGNYWAFAFYYPFQKDDIIEIYSSFPLKIYAIFSSQLPVFGSAGNWGVCNPYVIVNYSGAIYYNNYVITKETKIENVQIISYKKPYLFHIIPGEKITNPNFPGSVRKGYVRIFSGQPIDLNLNNSIIVSGQFQDYGIGNYKACLYEFYPKINPCWARIYNPYILQEIYPYMFISEQFPQTIDVFYGNIPYGFSTTNQPNTIVVKNGLPLNGLGIVKYSLASELTNIYNSATGNYAKILLGQTYMPRSVFFVSQDLEISAEFWKKLTENIAWLSMLVRLY